MPITVGAVHEQLEWLFPVMTSWHTKINTSKTGKTTQVCESTNICYTHFTLALHRSWIYRQLVIVNVSTSKKSIIMFVWMSVRKRLWAGTHCCFGFSHLRLLHTCFTCIQVQAKILQKTSFFLQNDTSNEQLSLGNIHCCCHERKQGWTCCQSGFNITMQLEKQSSGHPRYEHVEIQ